MKTEENEAKEKCKKRTYRRVKQHVYIFDNMKYNI